MRQVPFWLFGIGGVGSTLLQLLQDESVRNSLQARAGVEFRPVFVADSRAYLADPAGLDAERIGRAVATKRAGGSVAQLAGARLSQGPLADLQALQAMLPLERTIGVDATASDVMGPALLMALDAGAGVVLANKRPLTAGWEQFVRLTRTRRCRHEATVGAGLPVISTLQALLDTGDRVTRIQGCLSGTLGYICSALNRGEPYSQAVMRAVEAGYAEPDPRDDLCGLDVARKALILSRMLGRALELSDLDVRPMIPKQLEGLSKEEFMRRLPEADAEMAEMVQHAAQRGLTLSYVADLTAEGATIGLQEVDRNSPVGRLSGTDNVLVFHTERYHQTPLVIQGPGAGRIVTAAGVLSDMITLVREEF